MPTLMKACLEHLKLESENLSDFRAQWSALNDKDKADLRRMFAESGVLIDTDPPKTGV
jgi:N-methylhydantoinase B/oxoprolinase/acetone carboxylase alpha subunit